MEKAKKGPISIKTILTILSGKGRILLLVCLSLGFGQIPGVAVFLGLFIAYLGLRIAVAKSFIWMPQVILRKKIPSYFLIKVIKQILRFLKFMKKWSHPRYVWATQQTTTRIVNGLMIALVGVSLAISPPIPFSGLLAFVAVFSIAIGLLNDDGIFIIMGYICTLLYFITILFLLKVCSFSQMLEWGNHTAEIFREAANKMLCI
ncbi:MAG TPA: exopolysaccharide biosynthesis protein [Rhabdochlamydiaceae bacterium]